MLLPGEVDAQVLQPARGHGGIPAQDRAGPPPFMDAMLPSVDAMLVFMDAMLLFMGAMRVFMDATLVCMLAVPPFMDAMLVRMHVCCVDARRTSARKKRCHK